MIREHCKRGRRDSRYYISHDKQSTKCISNLHVIGHKWQQTAFVWIVGQQWRRTNLRLAEALCTDSMGSTDSTTYFSISLLLMRAGKLYRQYFSVLISCLCVCVCARRSSKEWKLRAKFHCKLQNRRGGSTEICVLNDLPLLWMDLRHGSPHWLPSQALRVKYQTNFLRAPSAE